MERLICDTGAAIELNALFQKLSIERGGDEEMDAQVARLFAEAEKIANPKAFYRQAHGTRSGRIMRLWTACGFPLRLSAAIWGRRKTG